jgi:glycerol-3-phosphate dehydrogenase (NAD(P)+)
MIAEGVATTESAYELAQRHGVEMPIVEQVYQILFFNKSPRLAIHELMTRESKSEVQ